jgi:hypothetical protein
MTASDLSAAITPGSTAYGDRQTLEANLQEAIPGGGGGPTVDGAFDAVEPGVDSADDPIAALLSGEINPGAQQGSLTDGLSVGDGPGPGGEGFAVTPEQVRLQEVATQAKHPLIRQMARNELRRLVGERV